MMGTLTNDMIRLRGEIASLRESRAALREDLAQWMDDLKGSVGRLRADFRSSHEDMARTSRDERSDFVSNISENLAAFRGEVLAEIAGARQAWSGKSANASSPASPTAEEQREITSKAKKKKR